MLLLADVEPDPHVHLVNRAHLSPLARGRGKAVQGALAVIHLTNQRSIACPHQRFTHPTVPVATPPRPSTRQGAMSHAGTVGLPMPSACLLRAYEKGKGVPAAASWLRQGPVTGLDRFVEG